MTWFGVAEHLGEVLFCRILSLKITILRNVVDFHRCEMKDLAIHEFWMVTRSDPCFGKIAFD